MLYIMNLILGNKVENVYWFFMTLFGIYLCMPVLANLVKNRKVLWYIVGTAFIMYSCFPVINQIIGITCQLSIPVAVRIDYISGIRIFAGNNGIEEGKSRILAVCQLLYGNNV